MSVRLGLHSYRYHTSHTLPSRICFSFCSPKASTFCSAYDFCLRVVPEYMTRVLYSYPPGTLVFLSSGHWFVYDFPIRVVLRLLTRILLKLQLLDGNLGSIMLMTALYDSYPSLRLEYLSCIFPILSSSGCLLVLLCILFSIRIVSDVHDSRADSYPN